MDAFHLKVLISAMNLRFLFLDDDVPRRASYGVYTSQLKARLCEGLSEPEFYWFSKKH